MIGLRRKRSLSDDANAEIGSPGLGGSRLGMVRIIGGFGITASAAADQQRGFRVAIASR
jgi:hypothetical protein